MFFQSLRQQYTVIVNSVVFFYDIIYTMLITTKGDKI